jgi:hypothetical protein
VWYNGRFVVVFLVSGVDEVANILLQIGLVLALVGGLGIAIAYAHPLEGQLVKHSKRDGVDGDVIRD